MAAAGDEPTEGAISAVLSSGCRLGAGLPLKRAGIVSGAWLVASLAPSSSKQFSLLVSSEDDQGEIVPTELNVTVSTELGLKELIDANGKGNLVRVGTRTKVENVSDIVSGGVYSLIGGHQKTLLDKQQWTQQADRVLEDVSTLTVRDACEGSMGPLLMWLDVKLRNNEGRERQLDGLLTSTTAAITVEAKHVAKEEHIDLVLRQAEFVRECARQGSDARLQGVRSVLPVLAASRFSDSMVALCEKKGIGVVKPNGAGHTYIPPAAVRPPLPGQRFMQALGRALRGLL